MRLKYVKPIIPVQDGFAKIMAMCWSPNNKKLAVCTADRTISLFDDNGEKRDKFSTKPSDPSHGKKSYVVKGLAFSPDSTKLAVGQSDDIIFVYKVGKDWGEKKVICNKFLFHSAVTCMVWPSEGPLVVGLAEGKVRAAYLKSSKSSSLYSSEHYVVSLTTNIVGKGILSGHADGSVIRFFFDDEGSGEIQGKIFTHTCPPYCLAWATNAIIVGGCDRTVAVYSLGGTIQKKFDYIRNSNDMDFTTAVCGPSGLSVVVGSFDRLRIYFFNGESGDWEESKPKEVENWYTIAALAWTKDGSKLTVGTLCGGVELFDCSLKKYRYKKNFEITYVDPSQVIVKNLSTKIQGVLKASQGHKIMDVKVHGKDRYIVARTASALLLTDMEQGLMSEISWSAMGGKEKLYFGYENVCIIFNAGEMTIVEYGKNNILGCVRTEFTNPHVLSVRLNEQDQNGTSKTLAYLVDLKTIAIIDLVSDQILSQISHESKIDWLELNESGKKMLFRDKRQRLHLVDVGSSEKKSMLSYCSFVQWVPDSDVVVAQNRNSLCVWYNIDSPDKITVVPIKGEVTEIQRYDNKTDVIVREGVTTITYGLDEGLIEFGSAITNRDFKRAEIYLEKLGVSEETENMWQNLGKLALESQILHIAERCFAAVGDVSKAQYLRETINIANEAASTTFGNGYDFYKVKARQAILMKEYKIAEQIYIEQDKVDEAIKMYQDQHKWDDALELAKLRDHPRLQELQDEYFRWLLETGQEDRAGELKEKEEDFEEAINLYLNAGLPSRAGRVITSMPVLAENDQLVQKIASSLMKGEFYEHAGDLYEKINDYRKALECYRLGNAFSRAVDLARIAFPEEVVILEEEWGDHLMSIKQLEAAIHHYIEAGKTLKALDSAVNGKLWKKAVDIMEIVDDPVSINKYFKIMAQHYYSIGAYDLAEHLLVEGGMTREAVEMYNRVGEWDKAYKLASQYLDPDEVTDMYLSQAKRLEEEGSYKEAEKLYISAQQPELAVAMYKNLKQYEQMMRLVKQHFPHTLDETYQHLAKMLETEGNYFQAEQFYLATSDWKSVVNMYRNVDMWEDAFRVAKTKGTPIAVKQIAYLWAKSLGGDSAVKLLNKFGLLESAIDYAAENCAFEFAFELARSTMKHKLTDVHYKYALFLEDEGKIREAEVEFIKAQRPKEAVLMYVHNQDWESAQRVAEAHDKDSVADVLIGQARFAFEKQDYQKAESLLLRAERGDLAVKYYKEAGMWSDALRVCKDFTPSKLPELQEEYELENVGGGTKDIEQLYTQARTWEEQGQYHKAVSCYVQIVPSKCDNSDFLEKCWNRAVDLSVKFLGRQQTEELVQDLAPKLQEIDRHTSAAQMYLKINKVKNAIDALIAAEEWGKAKKVATELNPQYVVYVDNRYKDILRSRGNTDQLADLDVTAALDLFVEQKQWKKCLEMAEKQGASVLHKYVAIYAAELLNEDKVQEALNLYVTFGTPAYSHNFHTYKLLISSTLEHQELFNAESYPTWAHLRDMLFDLIKNLHHTQNEEKDAFNDLLTVSHYYAIRSVCMGQSGLEKQAAKISISLLRYTNYIRVDKAFYEAGYAAKEVEWNNMAFVFWNHYLDICEAIEEKNPESVDYVDFEDTDIPMDVPIPSQMYLSDAKHDEVKEWVLAVSMDQQVEQILPLDERSCYEASLISSNGRHYQPCVVTGYPVLRNRLELGTKVANKDDWNKFLMAARVSDSSECQDVLKFMGNWCGGTGSLSYSFQ